MAAKITQEQAKYLAQAAMILAGASKEVEDQLRDGARTVEKMATDRARAGAPDLFLDQFARCIKASAEILKLSREKAQVHVE